jgi:hypothetical protein
MQFALHIYVGSQKEQGTVVKRKSKLTALHLSNSNK